MNQNIEIISPYHVGVRKEYIQAGYIKELQPIEGIRIEQINLSNTGMIVLDKSSLYYPVLKKAFKNIAKIPDRKLKAKFDSYGSAPRDPATDILHNVLGFELRRRAIRKAYMKNKTLKQRLSDWVERRVKKVWQV